MNYQENNTFTTKQNKDNINLLANIGKDKLKNEIITGLSANPKYISSKFFYDKKGSMLFEKITQLAEYYPTRTEKDIIKTITKNLNIEFTNTNLIELGSGDHSKISLLLDQIPTYQQKTITYTPVDISKSAIESSCKNLKLLYPNLKIKGIVADFLHQLNLVPRIGKRLFCFFGSTLGNLKTKEIQEFMTSIGNTMEPNDSLLLGLDMIKDIQILENAYNDSKQITAEFNKNILNAINNIINTDFNKNDFEHIAFYNNGKNRIEMHLKAKKEIVVHIKSVNSTILIKKNEMIHTENSHKFNNKKINDIGFWAGLNTEKILTDSNNLFSLIYYTKKQL